MEVEISPTSLQELAAEVASLRNEVAVLRKQWSEAVESRHETLDVDSLMKQLLATKSKPNSLIHADKRHETLQAVHVDNTLGHVKTMASLSGIYFDEVNAFPVRQSSAKDKENNAVGRRRYFLRGSCYGLHFRLSFEVEELLEAHVDEIYKEELQSFLEFVENECSPQLFFQGINQYGRLNQQRQQIVRELLFSYNRILFLATGYHCPRIIEIHRPDTKVSFVIHWQLRLSECGTVTTYFTVLERFLTTTIVQDKDGLASAGAIHALATCSGPQAVIRTLAELVMLRE
eukprot:gene1905-4999_t